MDRRKAVRYRLSAPVKFRWRTNGNAEHEAEYQASGVSCDVSVTGILIECDGECPPVHAEVQVVMTIEAQTSKFGIGGSAEVTRSYNSDDTHVFAADGIFELIEANNQVQIGPSTC